LACRAAVCGEHALITDFALKGAGIENYHLYATIRRKSYKYGFDIVEDQASTVAKHEGEYWLIDPYYSGFHG
jgi:hypothetical protein